jgi:hypothetical protein
MGTASSSAAVEPAGDPTPWTDVVSAIGAIVAAVAAVATVVVAIVAALYAKRQLTGLREQLTVAGAQLDEARTLRREQAQPYVVAYARPNPVHSETIDIVVRIFGPPAPATSPSSLLRP